MEVQDLKNEWERKMELSHLIKDKDDILKALDVKIRRIGKDKLIEDLSVYLNSQSHSPSGRDFVLSVVWSAAITITQLVKPDFCDRSREFCETGGEPKFQVLTYTDASLPVYYLSRYCCGVDVDVSSAIAKCKDLIESGDLDKAVDEEIMSFGKDILIEDMCCYFIHINKFHFGRHYVHNLLESTFTVLGTSIDADVVRSLRNWFDNVRKAIDTNPGKICFDELCEADSLEEFKTLITNRDFMLLAFFLYDPSFKATSKWEEFIEMEIHNSEENPEAISKALQDFHYYFKNPEADRIPRFIVPHMPINSLALHKRRPGFGVYHLSSTNPIITQSKVFSDAVDSTGTIPVSLASNYMTHEFAEIIKKTHNFDKAMEALVVFSEIIKAIKKQIESVMDNLKDWTTSFLNRNNCDPQSLKRAALSLEIKSLLHLMLSVLKNNERGRPIGYTSERFVKRSISSFIAQHGISETFAFEDIAKYGTTDVARLIRDFCIEKHNFDETVEFLVEHIKIAYTLINSVVDTFKDWLTKFLIKETPSLQDHQDTADFLNNKRLELISRAKEDAEEGRSFEDTVKWFVAPSISSFLSSLCISEASAVENTLKTFAEFPSFLSALGIGEAFAVENTSEPPEVFNIAGLFAEPDIL